MQYEEIHTCVNKPTEGKEFFNLEVTFLTEFFFCVSVSYSGIYFLLFIMYSRKTVSYDVVSP